MYENKSRITSGVGFLFWRSVFFGFGHAERKVETRTCQHVAWYYKNRIWSGIANGMMGKQDM